MAEKFPNLMEPVNPQIQDTSNTTTCTPQHLVIKLLITKTVKRTLQQESRVSYKGTDKGDSTLLTGATHTSISWMTTLKSWKRKPVNRKFYTQQTYLSKTKAEGRRADTKGERPPPAATCHGSAGRGPVGRRRCAGVNVDPHKGNHVGKWTGLLHYYLNLFKRFNL